MSANWMPTLLCEGQEDRFDVIAVGAELRRLSLDKFVVLISQSVILGFAAMVGNHDSELGTSDVPLHVLKEVLKALRDRLVGVLIQVLLGVDVIGGVGRLNASYASDDLHRPSLSNYAKEGFPERIARALVKMFDGTFRVTVLRPEIPPLDLAAHFELVASLKRPKLVGNSVPLILVDDDTADDKVGRASGLARIRRRAGLVNKTEVHSGSALPRLLLRAPDYLFIADWRSRQRSADQFVTPLVGLFLRLFHDAGRYHQMAKNQTIEAGLVENVSFTLTATIQAFQPLPDEHPCYALIGLITSECARIEHFLDATIFEFLAYKEVRVVELVLPGK